MVKKLLTIALGLLMTTRLAAQPAISESDVMMWAGTGPNSTLVCIGWDDQSASYTPTVVVWGVHWQGSIHLLDALDSIAQYDSHFTYSFSGGFLGGVQYVDPDLGLNLTPSGFNCNNYGQAYGSGTLTGTWLHISTSTCANYNHAGITNVVYPVDPALASSCPRPVALAASNLTVGSATVTINDTASVGSYEVVLRQGNTLVDSTSTTGTVVNYTGLTANTAYTVTVVSNCPDGSQTYPLTYHFRTPCMPMVTHAELPWSEDFNAYSGSVTYDQAAAFSNHLFCWDVPNPLPYQYLYVNSSSTVNAASGNCIFFGCSASSERHPMVVLPPFEDTPDALMLSFDARSAYSRGGFEVGTYEGDSLFVPIAECRPVAGAGWQRFSVTFAGRTTGRIALRGLDSDTYLDNVTVEELPSCVKPSQVLVSDIEATSAALTILDPNGATHFVVCTSAGDSVEIFSTSHTLSNLDANTLYTVRVRTLCGDSVTGATEASFRSGCGDAAVPFHDDFSSYASLSNGYSDAVAGGMLPCWGYSKSGTGGYVALFNASHTSTYAHPTGYTLKLVPSAAGAHDYYVLPGTDAETSSLELAFSTRAYNAQAGSLDVGYLTDAEDTATFVAVRTVQASDCPSAYQTETFLFGSAPAGARMALRRNANTASGWWYVADFDVHYAPLCERIAALRVDSVSATTISFSVSDPSDEGTYRYIIASAGWADTGYIYDTVYTIEGLAPATDYTLTVASVCSDGNTTMARSVAAATTCLPVATLPYVVDFEDWQAGAADGMDRCWDRLYANNNSLSTTNYPYVVVNSSTAYEGDRSLKLYSYHGSSRQYSAFFLPEFEQPVSTLKIGFMHKAGNTYFSDLRVLVGVSETTADTSTFTRVATIVPRSNNWEEYEVDFSSYSGSGKRITVIQASTRSTYITSYIDNVAVDTISSCGRPATLEVSGITAHEATLSWIDPSEAGSYKVRWSNGTVADSALVDGNSLALSQLDAATNYSVEVSSLCFGHYTRPRSGSFRTGCAVVEMPWEMNFDNVAATSDIFPCWSMYTGAYSADGTATLSSSTSAWQRNNTTVFGGSSHFKVNIYGNNKRWLVTPPVHISGPADLKFDVALTKYSNTAAIDLTASGLADDRFLVLATADSGAHWSVVGQWDDNTTPRYRDISATGDSVSLSLSGFVGQDVRIAFYGESTVSGADNDLHIDNLRVVAGAADTTTPQDTVSPQPQPQSAVYVVAEGTASAMYLPFRLYSAKYAQWTQSVYPASYLTELAGRTLDAFTYHTAIGSTFTPDPGVWTIKLAVTTRQNLQYGKDNTPCTTVFNGTPTYDPATGDMTFAFSTPFEYDGGNLLVYFDHQANTTEAMNSTTFQSLVVDNASRYACNTAYTTPYSGEGSVSAYLPTIKVSATSAAPQDTTVTPTADSILYWVGTGENSATFTLHFNNAATPVSLVWGYHWDDTDDDYTVGQMMEEIATADSRVSFDGLSTGFVSEYSYSDGTYNLTAPTGNNYAGLMVNGAVANYGANDQPLADGDDIAWMDADYDFFMGTINLGTTDTVYVTVPGTTPSDGRPFSPDDVLYWVGSGSGSSVVVVSWDDETGDEVALAWGVRYDSESYPSVLDLLDSIKNNDSRFNYTVRRYMGEVYDINTITYVDDILNLAQTNTSSVSVRVWGEEQTDEVDGDELETYSVWNGDLVEVSTSGLFSPVTVIPVPVPATTPVVHEDTLCTIVHALPYENDFSGYTLATNGRPFEAAAPLPECWTVFGNGRFHADYDTFATASLYFSGIGTSTSINNYGCVTPGDPFLCLIAYGNYDGTYATYLDNQRNYGTKRYAVLPPFDHSLGETRLTFDHRTSAASGAALLVGYIVADTADFVAVDSIATDYRVLHHDTVDFTQVADIPAGARLTLLWKSTDTTHTNNAPANYYCGIDNLKVEVRPQDTVAPVDTTVRPVEATVDASDILFWVGEGSNEAILAVNWADTALAWGYRFSGSATVQNMLDDIAAVDPRFDYLSGGFGLSDIRYIDTAAGMTDTLRGLATSYWTSTNNGTMDAGMGQTLANGDFEKWAVGTTGILVDSAWVEDWGGYWNYIYVYPMAITPVTVPDTTRTAPIDTTHTTPEHGPFCGPVGSEGCDAIRGDSSAFVAWATGCTIVRGSQNLSNPSAPVVTYGTEADAIGPVSVNNNMNVVSLGDGGTATLTFERPIRNGEGPDFAVFENGFDDLFLELAFVEVSSDGEHFVRFPATSLTQTETQTGPTGHTDATFINNLAGKYRNGYGTPFDLEELRDSTGIDIDSITHVRIVDVVGSIDPQYATYDAFGHMVNDPFPTISYSSGFDLAGVGVIHQLAADTTQPAERPQDASIAASAIRYWVGEGENSVVMAVNWADTALAWGFRFSSASVTAQEMMDAIATADSRFSYSGTGFVDDIHFTDTATQRTYGITPGNWWWSLLNHVDAMGLATELHNGDFFKWGDLAVATAVDSTVGAYGMEYTYVWTDSISPVSAPGTQGIGDVEDESVAIGVYPNPTADVANVTLPQGAMAQLYDQNGRLRASYRMEAGRNSIDLTAMPAGVYMLRVGNTVVKIAKR